MVTAVKDFLCSGRFSNERLKSDLGQHSSFNFKKAGPRHHIEELTNSCGSRPRDKMSARFSADLT